MLKILSLFTKNIYNLRMDRGLFHNLDAISKYCDITYSGLGWENYDDSKSIAENVAKMDVCFDVIEVWDPCVYYGWGDLQVPVCLRFNEMYEEDNRLKEIQYAGAGLVICHHQNDYMLFSEKYSDLAKFSWIPHSAKKSMFYSDSAVHKDIDVLLVGNRYHKVYPLRDRLYKIIRRRWYNSLFPRFSSKYVCNVFQHPGYERDDDPELVMTQFSEALRRSKIVVSCASKFKYRLGKYVEVPMCGAAFAADLPEEDQNYFKDFLIELDLSMSDQDIVDKITYYLEHEEERLEKIEKGLAWAKNYTQEKYAERFITVLQDFLEGRSKS